MSKRHVDKDELWNNVLADPLFQECIPEEIRSLFEAFVKELPDLLGDELLHSRVTAKTLIQAKVSFLKALVFCNVAQKLPAFVGKPSAFAQACAEMHYYALQAMLDNFEDIVLASMPPEVFLRFPELGLNEKVLGLIEGEGITIKQLLRTQPAAVVVTRNPLTV